MIKPMRTRVRRATPAAIAEAVKRLRNGELVAFPTETVYGLGAAALDAAAAASIYRVKGRPSDNPLIVHVSDQRMLETVAGKPSALARRLMRVFWPGPLTLILNKTERVPLAVTAGRRTVAVRCPAHGVARRLIRALGAPIAAPSANLSGRPSPTLAAHVAADLNGRIPLILDGGSCREGLESTIVDARGSRPVLLRPGTISIDDLERAAGVKVAHAGARSAAAPGRRHRHYAPSCPVVLVEPEQVRNGRAAVNGKVGLVHRTAWGGGRLAFDRRLSGDVARYARGLFAALRAGEAAGVDVLFVESVPLGGAGRAVMDRLLRAARATKGSLRVRRAR
jgi:L-threonylcarbamoyladenylate synthase